MRTPIDYKARSDRYQLEFNKKNSLRSLRQMFKKTALSKDRRCLKCENVFKSESKGNRLCQECK